MEKEISSGTMLGIVLIALAAVIGLGFGVFSIAKGVANEGTVGVQDNLAGVQDSAFEDYNDKIVTGTMVKSALQSFQGKSVAILINTTAMNKGVTSYQQHTAGCTVFSLDNVPYVNYNALLAKGSNGMEAVKPLTVGAAVGSSAKDGSVSAATGAQVVMNGEDAATMKDGALVISHAFAIDSTGKVSTDTGIGGLSRTGNCEFISPNSKFTANLIKDTSGTNVGILFTQMAK
jgi:hypothetical protein